MTNQNGLTSLHYAVQQGKEKIVENLCMFMNDINVRDHVSQKLKKARANSLTLCSCKEQYKHTKNSGSSWC